MLHVKHLFENLPKFEHLKLVIMKKEFRVQTSFGPSLKISKAGWQRLRSSVYLPNMICIEYIRKDDYVDVFEIRSNKEKIDYSSNEFIEFIRFV